jgi:phosphatidate cytidylyltransferase
MLGQRIVTALLLLALLLPTLWIASPWPFVALTLLLISAAAWEWARLNACGPRLSIASAAVLASCCILAVLGPWRFGDSAVLWWAAAALWVCGGAAALRRGSAGWSRLAAPARWCIGLVLLWTAWWALAQARIVGANFLLSVLCVVWAADIAAYFGGRAFGRHKLAPRISPGKTWEGVWCGMLGVLALAVLWMAVDARVAFDSASVFTQLRQRLGAVPMALCVLALAALSVVGDLFESMVKRAAGAKDASALLPGHGGVLDRVDALLPVLPCAMALTSV